MRPPLGRHVGHGHIEYLVDLAGYKHPSPGFDFVYHLLKWSDRSMGSFENESKIAALIERPRENPGHKEADALTFENFRGFSEGFAG
ncbi:microsomal dipeptidase [Thermococcus zilligii]|uniref:microsomal dipeptidase n=1 Tax=Thermococcus zilligii TaxID=54076 RepID=UPI00029A98D0|nr:microsomal dipeptidase [Thermococcus zilligii]